jgi:chromatin segregation and condensation protein Rec8/ScpA/Scc1 (kleisin family)
MYELNSMGGYGEYIKNQDDVVQNESFNEEDMNKAKQDITSSQENQYVLPQDEIYSVATDKHSFDWKKLLEQIIHDNNLDPFDIDISILTKTYLQSIQDLEHLDFAISGKLLTIAVFLLKRKAQYLVEHDISGIDSTIDSLQDIEQDDLNAEFDMLEDVDEFLDKKAKRVSRSEYKVKVRNPIARKRKVTLHDLISTLEKTFKQSNQRRKNLVLKNTDVEYTGPDYNKKKKDLKTVIQELLDLLHEEFGEKKAHLTFHNDVLQKRPKNDTIDVLHSFIPLLHLHNQEKVILRQQTHFNDIEIHKLDDDEKL